MGLPTPTLHSPYHPLRSLPCSLVGLKQDAVGGVLSMASSALCGSPVVTQGRTGLPGSPRAKRDDDFALAFLPAVPGLVSFDWLTSQARYVRVFIPRKAMHASGRLAMASLSQALLLGDLLSPHSAFQEHAAHGVEWSTPLSSKGSWGTCIPQGGTTFLLRAFTAHHLNKQRLINSLEAEVNESACLIESTGVTPPYKISRFHRESPLDSCRLFPDDHTTAWPPLPTRDPTWQTPRDRTPAPHRLGLSAS